MMMIIINYDLKFMVTTDAVGNSLDQDDVRPSLVFPSQMNFLLYFKTPVVSVTVVIT
jgi:hypothetical protein